MNDLQSIFEDKGLDKVVQLHIADIHFGAFNPNDQLDILSNNIINTCITRGVNELYINGDLFHKSNNALSSNTVNCAIEFISRLKECADEIDMRIYILKGTMSHDGDQLKVFDILNASGEIPRINVIEETCIRRTHTGLNVGFIPEEYNKSENYYKRKVLNYRTDLIVFHGVYHDLFRIPNMPFTGLNGRVPMFTRDDFKCTKLVMAGHIHSRINDDIFYYCGSPYDWTFSNDGRPKGFYIVTIDRVKDTRDIEFIPLNTARYITINIDGKLHSHNPADIIDYINETVNMVRQSVSYDTSDWKFRIQATFNNPSVADKISAISDYYSKSNKVMNKMFSFQAPYLNSLIGSDEVEESHNDFLFDSTIDEVDKISIYISNSRGENISSKEIRELLGL